jgi:hypothetical protein
MQVYKTCALSTWLFVQFWRTKKDLNLRFTGITFSFSDLWGEPESNRQSIVFRQFALPITVNTNSSPVEEQWDSIFRFWFAISPFVNKKRTFKKSEEICWSLFGNYWICLSIYWKNHQFFLFAEGVGIEPTDYWNQIQSFILKTL